MKAARRQPMRGTDGPGWACKQKVVPVMRPAGLMTQLAGKDQSVRFPPIPHGLNLISHPSRTLPQPQCWPHGAAQKLGRNRPLEATLKLGARGLRRRAGWEIKFSPGLAAVHLKAVPSPALQSSWLGHSPSRIGMGACPLSGAASLLGGPEARESERQVRTDSARGPIGLLHLVS